MTWCVFSGVERALYGQHEADLPNLEPAPPGPSHLPFYNPAIMSGMAGPWNFLQPLPNSFHNQTRNSSFHTSLPDRHTSLNLSRSQHLMTSPYSVYSRLPLSPFASSVMSSVSDSPLSLYPMAANMAINNITLNAFGGGHHSGEFKHTTLYPSFLETQTKSDDFFGNLKLDTTDEDKVLSNKEPSKYVTCY